MIYCAAQCPICRQVVLALDQKLGTICECGEISITGNANSSSTNYRDKKPKAFQVEIDKPPANGIISESSSVEYKILNS